MLKCKHSLEIAPMGGVAGAVENDQPTKFNIPGLECNDRSPAGFQTRWNQEMIEIIKTLIEVMTKRLLDL